MAKRTLVVDPATNEIVNVILVPDDGSFELPGMQLIEDQWGVGPGDRWDPAAKRAERVERRPEPLPPPELQAARAKLDEAEQAWRDGDAARFARALQDAQAALSGLVSAPGREPLP